MSPGMLVRQCTVEQEFEKNPQLQREDLDHLREWLETQKHLPNIKDEMLILFHHSCQYNLERAKQCIDSYYTVRTMAPYFFSNRDLNDPQMKRAVETLNMAMLPVLDPNGCQLFYHGLRDSEPSKYFHADDNKLIFMTIDAWLLKQGTSPGLVLIMDMKGAKIGHLTRVSINALRIGSKYVQEGSPLRLKAIHIINPVPWVEKVIAIIRPFTNKSIMDMMHFHKTNGETLFEHVPRECLPSDLGGTLPPLETHVAENKRVVDSLREYFKEEESQRVDESLRDKKKKKNKATEQLPELKFNKLEID